MASQPITTIFTKGRRLLSCVVDIIGCCRKDKAGIGDNIVMELMEKDEVDSEPLDIEDVTMKVLAAQMDEIYFF